MAFDIGRGVTVLFGGYGYDGAAGRRRDTWEWDGVEWNEIVTEPHPEYTSEHAMAYDVARGLIVMYGGYGPLNLKRDDMWVYSGL
jgi:hypothetical protein